MMKKVVIIGNGGHAKVIKDVIHAQGEFILAGYLDNNIDNYYEESGCFYDNLLHLERYRNDYYFIIAIGNNKVREQIFEQSNIAIKQFAKVIHPTAIISPYSEIGYGTVVMPNAVVNADTVIGEHVIINTSAVVEHDNRIGDYVHISPGAMLAGGVSVGRQTHVAIGAKVIPQINIGQDCVIGAGATVINDIESYQTVVGTPAISKE